MALSIIARIVAVPAVRVAGVIAGNIAIIAGSIVATEKVLNWTSKKPDFIKDNTKQQGSLTLKQKWAMLKS